MSIIIGADIVPVKSNVDLFENSQISELIGVELKHLLDNADYRIFNLETPLTDLQSPIRKEGPNLSASISCVMGIKALGANLLTLANNHIMDQDSQGLVSTMKVLESTGIGYLGAGNNLQSAQRPFFFILGEKKYGVYACAEHEFSIASNDSYGANPFDPLESPDHVNKMKDRCDFAIVLYHGGKEQYRYPSPNLQKVCRKLVDKGADLVVCQHSHCVGCKEVYKGKTIVYGQGNFLFNAVQNEYWNTSMLIRLSGSGEIDFIPLQRYRNGVRIARGKRADSIIEEFERRSEEIKQPGYIEEKFLQFSRNNIIKYVLSFSGKKNSTVFRIINKASRYRLQEFYTKMYIRKNGIELRNYIECEAHRELILERLKDTF